MAVVKMRNKIYKARVIGGGGPMMKVDFPSKQLLEDPFADMSGYGTLLTKPPYSMEQLVLLAEKHPVHGAALEQKSVDVVGKDVLFTKLSENADEKQRDLLKAWLEDLPKQQTLVELLQAMMLDKQTTGWGMWEVARDKLLKLRRLYHVPAHTVRAHRDNARLVQIRGGKQVWFKRWGAELADQPVLASNGRIAGRDVKDPSKLANELLVFRTSSRRSTWYGVPNYVSAIGQLTLAIAARDYNIKFFTNGREPRYIIVVSGLDEDEVEATLDELELSLKVQHAEPHRNLLIPLTGKDTKLDVIRMTSVQNEMHFVRLMELTERDILAAHRIPPDRVGVVTRGALGGNASANINRIYRDAVVATEQLVLKDRLNRFLRVEFARAQELKPEAVLWGVDFESVDLSDEAADVANVLAQVKANTLTLNEARVILGQDERPDMGVTLVEWLAKHSGGAAAMAASLGGSDVALQVDGLNRAVEAIRDRLDQFGDLTLELVTAEGSDGHEGAGEADRGTPPGAREPV